MTQITCGQTGSESTKLDLLSSCEPGGWLIRGFTSLRGPVRLSVCQVAPSNVLETPRCLADARVITTGPLRRVCYPPFKNNGSISCWAPTHCCEGGYSLETLGQMIFNTHCLSVYGNNLIPHVCLSVPSRLLIEMHGSNWPLLKCQTWLKRAPFFFFLNRCICRSQPWLWKISSATEPICLRWNI